MRERLLAAVAAGLGAAAVCDLIGALIGAGWPRTLGVRALRSAGRLSAELVRRRRVRAVEQSLPSVIRDLADSLATGVPLDRAAAAAGGGGQPACRALARYASARANGADRDESLARLARGDREGVWGEVAAAIALHGGRGGDLAGSLRRVADVLDEEVRAKGEARASIAQARFTAKVVCGLPATVLAGAELLRPGLVGSLLASAPAAALTFVSLTVQCLCLLVIRRIASSVAG